MPALLKALGATDNVLAALQAQFSGEWAGELSAFLEAHAIPAYYWSRFGD